MLAALAVHAAHAAHAVHAAHGGRSASASRTAPRLPALLAVVGIAWTVLIGLAGIGAPMPIGFPAGPAELLVAGSWWVLMTLAMMGPALLPAARHLAMNTLRPARTVVTFVAAYLAVWLVVGVALAGIAGRLVAVPGPFPTAGVVLVAAGWQLAPWRRRCLRACRGMRVPPAAGAAALRAAAERGATHGLACVGACGPLMLVMLVAPGPMLVWTALFAALVWAEKVRGLRRTLAYPTAAGLTAVALLLVVLAFAVPGAVPPMPM